MSRRLEIFLFLLVFSVARILYICRLEAAQFKGLVNSFLFRILEECCRFFSLCLRLLNTSSALFECIHEILACSSYGLVNPQMARQDGREVACSES